MKKNITIAFFIILLLSMIAAAGPSIFKVYQGGTGLSAVSSHQVFVGTATNVFTAKTVPDCTDSGGNHINYTQSTDAFSCGTSGTGGGSANMFLLENCTPDNSGYVFWTASALTNWRFQHWEWDYGAPFAGTDTILYCSVKIPHTLPTGTAKIVLDFSANDGTASHSMNFKTCDIVESTTVNVGALTCQSNQTFNTTSTAYAPSTLTFAVNATLAADNILVVAIHATSKSGLLTDPLMNPPRMEFQ